ncbi:MAG: class I SAM-dependent methyltransferase [Candidatus Obscuribacterales bacterium]|nr:class I SAM-dependent methyltransferase [Candidatus Obscuribacterales bacterium]
MQSSGLRQSLGVLACMCTWDTTVLDRWIWLSNALGPRQNCGPILDVGCGKGAFTIALSSRGFDVLGLTWSPEDQQISARRAKLCAVKSANFEVQDIRTLLERRDLFEKFEVAVCLEVIEHIIDDRKALDGIFACLQPGGYLFLSTPNLNYIPLGKNDWGPYEEIEDGRHVRKGYSREGLETILKAAGFTDLEFSFCSGFFSQKITGFFRACCKINKNLARLLITPLRFLPFIFTEWFDRSINWPAYSICVVARKAKS